MPKSYQNIGKIESNRLVVSVEDSLACPRMVTRIWGIIVAIGEFENLKAKEMGICK